MSDFDFEEEKRVARSCFEYYGVPFYWRQKKQMDASSFALPESYGLEDHVDSSTGFVVMKDHQMKADEYARTFAWFPSPVEFYQWVQSVPVEERHFYEKIPGDVPRKFALDIDVGLKEAPEIFNDVEGLFDAVMTSLQTVLPMVNLSKDVLVSTAHREDKKSFHITIDNFACENQHHAKDIYLELLNHIDERYHPAMDSAVYGSNQAFRMVGSSKGGKSNRLVFQDRYVVKGQEIVYQGGSDFYKCWFSSLWTTISEKDEVLPKFGHTKTPIVREAGSPISWSFLERNGELSEGFKAMNPRLFGSIQLVGQTDGLLMFLNPNGYCCPTCSRIHEHENPFITVSSKGDVLFNCRRANGRVSKIGQVDVSRPSSPFMDSSDDLWLARRLALRGESQSEPLGSPEAGPSTSGSINGDLEKGKKRKSETLPDRYFKLPQYRPRSVYREKYVRPFDLDNFDIHIEEAPMGTGKSFQIREYIQRKNPKRILYLSARQMYASSVFGELQKLDLGFNLYLDISKKEILGTCDRLVLQMESIHHLRHRFEPYDLLVMDESESLMKQLSSPTMNKNIREVIQTFESLVQTSKKIVVMDAFMTDRSVLPISYLRPDGRVNMVANRFEVVKKPAYHYEELGIWFNSMLKDLEAKKKIVSCWASNTQMKKIALQLKERGFRPLIYNAETDDDKKRALDNVNSVWNSDQFDILMYSPTITVGVNFNIENVFDKLYVYGSCMSCPVRDIFQMTLRVRHLREAGIHFCLQTQYFNADLPTRFLSYEQMKEDNLRLDDQYKMFEQQEKIVNLPPIYRPTWFEMNHRFNKREDNASVRDYQRVFNFFLVLCGYSEPEKKVAVDGDITANDILQIVQYRDIPSLNADQVEVVQRLIDSKLATTQHKLQMNKYHFDRHIRLDISSLLREKGLIVVEDSDLSYQEWSESRKIRELKEQELILDIKDQLYAEYWMDKKHNDLIRQIHFEKNNNLHTALMNRNHLRVFNDTLAAKFGHVKRLCSLLQMKNSASEFQMSSEDFKEKAVSAVLTMERELFDSFKFRMKVKEDCDPSTKAVKLLHHVFNSWNGSSIKLGERTRKRVNGARVEVRPVVKEDIMICDAISLPSLIRGTNHQEIDDEQKQIDDNPMNSIRSIDPNKPFKIQTTPIEDDVE